jgi:hypothetical protein
MVKPQSLVAVAPYCGLDTFCLVNMLSCMLKFAVWIVDCCLVNYCLVNYCLVNYCLVNWLLEAEAISASAGFTD